jgi:hypothetical protein
VCLQARRCIRYAARQQGLGALEQVFGDDRLEVTAPAAHAVLGHVDDAA